MFRKICRRWRCGGNIFAGLFVPQLALLFTRPPRRLAAWLEGIAVQPAQPPRHVVGLDGGGLPGTRLQDPFRERRPAKNQLNGNSQRR